MYCNKCGQSIADDSRFCKFCGASQESNTVTSATAPPELSKIQPTRRSGGKTILWVLGALFALIVLSVIVDGSGSTPGSGNASNATGAANLESDNLITSTGATAVAPASDTAQVEPTTPDNWYYSTDVDKVRRGTSYFAKTTSTNSIHQNFPYDSDTTMTMTVRKTPAYGTDVILTISSGQMMCPSYDGCSGTVRFDDGSAERVEFNGPADNSSDTVFVVGAKSFIAKLKKAKKVVIEKTLYEAGNPQFEFDVSGLKWDR